MFGWIVNVTEENYFNDDRRDLQLTHFRSHLSCLYVQRLIDRRICHAFGHSFVFFSSRSMLDWTFMSRSLNGIFFVQTRGARARERTDTRRAEGRKENLKKRDSHCPSLSCCYWLNYLLSLGNVSPATRRDFAELLNWNDTTQSRKTEREGERKSLLSSNSICRCPLSSVLPLDWRVKYSSSR